MNAAGLYEDLIAQGCNPANFRVQGKGGYSDIFCLERRVTGPGKGTWEVFYSERGMDSPPMFSSPDEEEAVRFFRAQVLSLVHHHCVGYFDEIGPADLLDARVKEAGIGTVRSDYPYSSATDRRYQVFVIGKDIFRARALLGEKLPLTNSSRTAAGR